jgi:hypothetical protein
MLELGMFLIQVAASMQKDIDAHVPSYPNLPSKLICFLHSVTLHVIDSSHVLPTWTLRSPILILSNLNSQADPDTDEVYAQMTLQPVNTVSI